MMVWVEMILLVTAIILILNIETIFSFLINLFAKNKVTPIKVMNIADNAGGNERYALDSANDGSKLRKIMSTFK